MTALLRSLPAEAASKLLAAALVAAGVPAPIAAGVAALAPHVLGVLADLLDDHARGAPLPEVVLAQLPDASRVVAELVAADLHASRDTLPPGGEEP